MADYYLIRHGRGPDWDESQPRREQAGWDEHAGFMDALDEAGVVVLGGPVGEVNDQARDRFTLKLSVKSVPVHRMTSLRYKDLQGR